ncbi:MAG: sugar phosphate isomerase/epimerase family protein [Phycisphaeraceae bacterium]
MQDIAFNTANLVARVTDYRFELTNWLDQHAKTAAATDDDAWRQICREIAEADYRAVEVWVAHVDPATHDPAQIVRFRQIMDEHGLVPIGIAGGLATESCQAAHHLDAGVVNGGFGNASKQQIVAQLDRFGISANHENHPEKNAQQIIEQVDLGDDRLGVALDTGWLGTQGADGPAVVRELGTRIRNVHVKDVRAAGGHETVPLGEGCVDLPGIFRELKALDYDGWLSWEDEPEDRNPMAIAVDMRQWIEQQWEQA